MKKTCLNCAFCMRCQSKQVWTGENWASNDTQELLTVAERSLAQKGDFSFIGKAKQLQNEWKRKYDILLQALAQGRILKGPHALELLLQEKSVSPGAERTYALKDFFNMGDMPIAPDADYMVCWHKQWGPETDTKELAKLNKTNKCFFFYPYTKKGNKSFDGCEKEWEAALSANRFKTTNWLVIGGILATVCSMLLAFFIYIAQKQDAQLTAKTLQETLSSVNTQTTNTQQILTDIQNQINALSTQEETDE